MLKVKGNYLYENKKPFFWLGDTAWLLFEKLSNDEIRLYLKNRKLLGYNVIQAVLVHSIPKSSTKNVNDLSYYENIKMLIQEAEQMGLYMALLPTWGSLVKEGYLNDTNATKLGQFLSSFFKDCNNIIWVLGGDIRGDENFNVYNILGSTLKQYNPDKLITFHPFGRTGSYLWFNDSPWLDFNMFQSGHRRYDQLTLNCWDDKNSNEDSYGEDSYKYVQKNNTYPIKKPCLDAEPSYEGIVQGLHDPQEPYWEARHIRRYAYWSVLEGACGFTYGNNAIMQFYKGNEPGSYGVRETWQTALHAEGAAQMQYLKQLMESVDFTKGFPHPEYILNNKERHHRTSVFASDDFMIIYTYKGDLLDIDLSRYQNQKMEAYYMNPQNNAKSFIGIFEHQLHILLRPTKRHELSNDWVILFKEI